jgi:uncharacterized protein (TIGR00661 family)
LVKFNTQTVLIAPLDWGLGHATRCIPVIRILLKNNYTVIIAAEGKQKKLLETEFSQLKFLPLKGYDISYSKEKILLPLKILIQIPKILTAIKYENKWLDKITDAYKIDLVISDNRFGLHTKKVPCIFITHQLQIKAPYKWLEKVIQKINYKYINQFNQCWIPDFEGEQNIAGELSHPKQLPKTAVKYIGPLSRFEKKNEEEKAYDFCFLLSGPEPQRTLLEENILKEVEGIDNKFLLVRGLPEKEEVLSSNNNITIKNHLPEKELLTAILQSEYIVCRSGYTTVMEVLSLQKKSILIPTPGQTEQEYLAEILMKQHWCLAISQQSLSLKKIIQQVSDFKYVLPIVETINLENIIKTNLQQFSNGH